MNSVYIIAEAGVNHNGSLDMALQLCDAAKGAGANAVKFQTWKTEDVMVKDVGLASYQEKNIMDEKIQTQFDMVKKLELSYSQFVEVKQYCDKIGIDFISTGETAECLDFLFELGMPYIKVSSGDLTNIPLLKHISTMKGKVLLSTGMSSLSEVEKAVLLLDKDREDLVLLHCTTNYPCPMEEVNLNAMLTLKEAFKCDVGYSDHTMGVEVPIAAVAMGAKVIEKHFTLNRRLEGPDHKASLESAELKYMVDCIRNIELALGDGIKRPNKSEMEISEVVLKRIVAGAPIKQGELLTSVNMTVKRSSTGIKASFWDLIEGRTSPRNYTIDEPIVI